MPKRHPKGLTREQVEKIVRKEAPGYRVAPERQARGADGAARYAKPDATVPSVRAIREKYARRGPGTDRVERRAAKPRKGKAPARSVELEAEPGNADARRVAPKRILVSGSGKVISRQG
jgi:hypothetical protein